MTSSPRSTPTPKLPTAHSDVDDDAKSDVSTSSSDITISTSSRSSLLPIPNVISVADKELYKIVRNEGFDFYGVMNDISVRRTASSQPISLQTKTTRNESAMRSTLTALPSSLQAVALNEVPKSYSALDLISATRFREVRVDESMLSADDIWAARFFEMLLVALE